MQEFVVAYMLDPVEIGTRFTMWPLHMTLLPWFEAPDADAVTRAISGKLKGMKPFEVSVGERASFGIQKRLPVMLIKPVPELQTLHEILLEVVSEYGWSLEGRYTGNAFKPHVTQKAGRDAAGVLSIDRLYIVEAQSQNYRQIVGKVDLSA